MLPGSTNESCCLRVKFKDITEGHINTKPPLEPNPSAAFHGFSPFHSVLLFAVVLLVFRGLYVWTFKYKLQFLLRISLLLFATSLTAYHGTEFYYPSEEESDLSLLLRTSFWSSANTASGLLCLTMLLVRYHWGPPLNIVKDSKDVGFGHLKDAARKRHLTVRELCGKILRHRDPGQLNPIFPNGWIPLIESSEVPRGRTVSAIAVGNKFCIYRGQSGEVFVLDAYCPHMGADLSAGGQVVGDKIECPFHGWQFCGSSGKCIKIPYSNKVPDVAKAKVWESRELNGYIFIWHHAEGDPPAWEVPPIPEIENGHWIYRGRSELTVLCHIQEIPENGADIAHLPQVHSSFVFYGPALHSANGQVLKHEWRPQWEPDEKEPHRAKVNILQRFLVFGYEVPWTRIDASIEQIGPASVHLYMKTKFGSGVMLQYITPEGPLQQKVVHLFYTEPRFKYFPAIFLFWGEFVMIQRDIAVWNNKKFLKNPLLVKEDRLISKFRRWFSQFYSEHSPTLRDLQQRSLDW